MEKDKAIEIILEYEIYVIKREVTRRVDNEMKFLYDKESGDYIPLKYMKEIITNLKEKNVINDIEGDSLKYIALHIYYEKLIDYRCLLLECRKLKELDIQVGESFKNSIEKLYKSTKSSYDRCKLLIPELELPIPELELLEIL